MQRFQSLVLALSFLVACRRAESRQAVDPVEAQVVALTVWSEPAGANVKVGRIERTWTTPCDVADFSLQQRGMIDVEISLEGHETAARRVWHDGQAPTFLEVKLVAKGKPSTGTRLRVKSTNGPLRLSVGKSVVEDDQLDDVFLPEASLEKVLVEFLDPKTGVVTQLPMLDPVAPGVPHG
jgi:hypothetical protein